MAKKIGIGKLTKVSYMSTGVIIGSMIGGAALSSAGWYYADRLDLSIGESVDINQVATASSDCPVGKTSMIKVTTEDGTTYEQEIECSAGSPIKKLKYTKDGILQVQYQLKTTKSKTGTGTIADEKDGLIVKGKKDINYSIPKTMLSTGPSWKIKNTKVTPPQKPAIKPKSNPLYN